MDQLEAKVAAGQEDSRAAALEAKLEAQSRQNETLTQLLLQTQVTNSSPSPSRKKTKSLNSPLEPLSSPRPDDTSDNGGDMDETMDHESA
jgi:hypothetical protein